MRRNRQDVVSILFLLLLCILYRLAFLLLVPRVLDNADAIHYAEAARRFAEGAFLAHDPKIPVLYPLLGGLLTRLLGDAEWGCRWVSFLFSCLTVLPVYGIARRLHGERAGVWAGVIFALWPWLADYAGAVSTEALAVFLWLTGFWLLLQWRRGRYLVPVLTGLCFGALSLTRAEGMLIALAALPAAALVMQRPGLRAVHWAWVYGGVVVLVLVASALFNRMLTGAANPNVRVGYIVEEFDVVRFVATAADTITDVLPVMLGPVLMVLLGVGVVARPLRERRVNEELALLLLCAVQLAASWFVLSPAPRYLMAPLVGLSLWSAAGLVFLGEWLRAGGGLAPSPLPSPPKTVARGMDSETVEGTAGFTVQGSLSPQPSPPKTVERGMKWGTVLGVLPAVALLGFFAIGAARTIVGEYLSERPRQPVEYKAAGLWMREHLEPGLVFTRKPQVAWYAGMPSTGPLDTDTLEGALARAREAGAKYLVVDERYAPPALLPLLEEGALPQGLEVLGRFEEYEEARVVVIGVH